MSDATKRNARRAPGASVETAVQKSLKPIAKPAMGQVARYRVEIVNPATGRPKVWDTYADRERAESVAQTLRRLTPARCLLALERVPGGSER